MSAPPVATSRPLPPDAAEMLERGRVGLREAYEFLGIARSAAYPMATRYLRRTTRLTASGRPFDVAALRPRRNKAGDFIEIPCIKMGAKYVTRTDLLVEMLYPEARGVA